MAVSEDLARRQAEAIRAYGYRAQASGQRVLIARSEYHRLEAQVLSDPRLDAIGRGWYLNGNQNTVITPDWQWDHTRIALLRLMALTVYRPARRIIAALVNGGAS